MAAGEAELARAYWRWEGYARDVKLRRSMGGWLGQLELGSRIAYSIRQDKLGQIWPTGWGWVGGSGAAPT